MDGMVKEAQQAAQALGMQLQFVPANNPEEITGAFSGITTDRADALCVFPSPMLFAEYSRIVSIVEEKRLPTIYAAREGAELGGLMSYGTNLADQARQTAPYVDKILKGAQPAELPVQQATKFELVINLNTAKALGLKVPAQLQQLADDVIE
jgi:putative ABC transport system substrate-binding protein